MKSEPSEKKMAFKTPGLFFSFLNRVERVAAYGQGKGYSGATIDREVRLLQSLGKGEPKLAIDVGGNVGDYTACLRKRNPRMEIHTFEPSATNIGKLRSRFDGDSLITLVPFALSNENGSATLFANQPGSGMASLTKRRLEHLSINFDSHETIDTIRFEDYWKVQLGSRPINMVKIDIEGHELTALKGFGSALNASKVIQFEFGGTDIDTRTFFQDFWYFFKSAGFWIYRFTPFGLQRILSYAESDECFVFTNFLAVNQR